MVTRGGSALIFVAVSLTVSAGSAQPGAQRIKLRYSAPAPCPDDLELVQAVEGFLGQSLRDAREQDLAIDVSAQGDEASGYSAKLSFVGAQGAERRYVDHPSCGKLVEAAALMIAIAIDPERVKAHQHSEQPTGARPTVTPVTSAEPAAPLSLAAPPTTAPPASTDRGAPPTTTRLSNDGPQAGIAVLALANSGMLPGLAPGIGADFALRLGPVEVGVDGRYWASRNAAVPTRPASSVDVSLLTAGLRLCGVKALDHWTPALCLRGDLGDMEGTGLNVGNARTRHALFATLGASAALSYTRHRLAPLAGVGGHWAARRTPFGVLRDGQEVEAFQPDSWGLSGFVGLAYQL